MVPLILQRNTILILTSQACPPVLTEDDGALTLLKAPSSPSPARLQYLKADVAFKSTKDRLLLIFTSPARPPVLTEADGALTL